MQRTISAMVGKGSVNHNSRKFRAENVDGTRTHLNIDYCTEQLKAENPHEWIGRMNNIQACVREVVGKELIYI